MEFSNRASDLPPGEERRSINDPCLDSQSRIDEEFASVIDKLFAGTNSPLDVADSIIDDIAGGTAIGGSGSLTFNTWPMGVPSPRFPRLFVICRDSKCLNDAFQAIDDWCKETVKTSSIGTPIKRNVIFYTDKWLPCIFERYEAKFLTYAVRNDIWFSFKLMTDYGVQKIPFLPDTLAKLRKMIRDRFRRKYYSLIEQLNSIHSIKYDRNKNRLFVDNIDNLNLFIDNVGDLKFTISTEVGVKRQWFNNMLFPKLLKNPKAVENLAAHYQGCEFTRFVRLNFVQAQKYFGIESFDSLADYIKLINKVSISRSKVPKQQCINDLLALGLSKNSDHMQELISDGHAYWHWLEYLRIIESPVDMIPICARDNTKALAYLEAIFERHIAGMRMIDIIANLVP